MVIRGGAGLFYDLGTGRAADAAAFFPGAVSRIVLGVPLPFSAQSVDVPPISLNPPFPLVNAFAPDLQLPRSWEWNLAVEKGFRGHQELTATYVGQHGQDLLRQQALYRPNANFSSAFLLTDNSAFSNYQALELQYRASAGALQTLVNYTYSHSLDNSSNDVVAGLSNTVVSGASDSAYAAQELAAKGIAVLQMGYDHVGRSTPAEAPRAMAAIEGAIDALSKDGIIDRNRVGIMGFSRTVYHVAYTLTHSSYPIAAATLADGFDGDYFQTIAFGMTEAPDAIAVNGASPWGAGLEKWLERSPLFAVDRVSSPVRLEAYGMDSVLGLWGWYSLLSRRNMPVDMIVLPHAPHLLAKPWERMASQQGDVDWFCYWLKGEQDSSHQKAAEYRRWRELRSLLDSHTAGRTGPAVQRGSGGTGAEPISSTALHPHL